MKSGFSATDTYRRLIEHLATAVIVLEDDLTVAYANPSAETLFARSASNLAGSRFSDLCQEDDKTQESLLAALREQHPFTKRETHLLLPSGAPSIIVDYTVTPMQDVKGKRNLLMEFRSLDRLLRISREDNLVATHQATRALVRGVAHEVKNPLGGIRGAAQLLARELSDGTLKEYTEIIISETDRLRHLVDKMLGPRTPPSFKQVNVHQILERVRSVIMAESGDRIALERDYDPSLPEVRVDEDQLIQAFLNIVRNACQALLENRNQRQPHIVLRTRAIRQYTIGIKRHRLSCLVEIEDNGPGIPKELAETLFYPMVSGRPNGTGLGLSIAQSIINQHKGLIECESVPGRTSFKVLLPIDNGENSPQTEITHAS